VISATDLRDYVVVQSYANLIVICVLLIVMVGSNIVFSQDIEELVVRCVLKSHFEVCLRSISRLRMDFSLEKKMDFSREENGLFSEQEDLSDR